MLVRCKCGWEKSVKDELQGKSAKCPKCGETFRLEPAKPSPPIETTELIPVDEPEVATQIPARIPPVELLRHDPPPIQQPQVVYVAAPAPAPAAPPQVTTHVHTQVVVNNHSGRSHALGKIAMLFGVLALMVSWIPLVGFVGMPLALLGVVIGGLGLLVALVRGGDGLGYSVVGLGTCCLAMFMMFASTGAAVAVTASAVNDVAQAQQRAREKAAAEANPAPDTPAAPAMNLEPGIVVAAVPAAVLPVATAPSATEPEPLPPGPAWEDGKMRVEIVDVELGKATLLDARKRSRDSSTTHLVINLKATNRGRDKMQFSGLAGETGATLRDDQGRIYAPAIFENSTPKGQAVRRSILPGKQALDVLVFEPLKPDASTLILSVPPIAFGRSVITPIELVFPVSEIVRE